MSYALTPGAPTAQNGYLATLAASASDVLVSFGSKLVERGAYSSTVTGKMSAGYVGQDQLGSMRYDGGPKGQGAASFYPWGAEQGTVTPNDRVKFATYHRDGETGIDYAMNRYYSSGSGRFLTPDPYAASANPSNPLSWNRDGYANADPINGNDPTGLDVGDWGPDPNTPTFGCDLFGGCVPGFIGCSGIYGIDDWWDDGFEPFPGPFQTLCPLLFAGPQGNRTRKPPRLSILAVDECIFPNGIGISGFKWTLAVKYQVLADSKPLVGVFTWPGTYASEVTESVVATGGEKIAGGGAWCLITFTECPCAPGSLTPQHTFWDILAGNGSANQSFSINGQVIPVTFPGSQQQSVLRNVYDSAHDKISIGNGAFVGTSATRKCGRNGDPAP